MFENRFYVTDKMIKEYIKKIVCKKLILMGAIISTLGIFLSVLSYAKGNKFMLGLYLTTAAISMVTTILTPMATFKEAKKNQEALHNGKRYETVVTFDDKIYMREGKFSIDINYSQIKKLHVLNHFCALMFGKNNGILFTKDGFSEGNFEDFMVFIKERAQNLK